MVQIKYKKCYGVDTINETLKNQNVFIKEINNSNYRLYDWFIEAIDKKFNNITQTINALSGAAANNSTNGEYTSDDGKNLSKHLNNAMTDISKYDDSGYDDNQLIDDGYVNIHVRNTVRSLTKTILLILQVASVAGIIFTGIKYMFASTDAKADMKKSATSLVIGLIIVFGASAVIDITVSIFGDIIK